MSNGIGMQPSDPIWDIVRFMAEKLKIKPFECKYCGKQFYAFDENGKPIDNEKGEKIICDMCSRRN